MTAMKNFPTGIAMLVKYIVVALPHFPQVIGSARLCAAAIVAATVPPPTYTAAEYPRRQD